MLRNHEIIRFLQFKKRFGIGYTLLFHGYKFQNTYNGENNMTHYYTEFPYT